MNNNYLLNGHFFESLEWPWYTGLTVNLVQWAMLNGITYNVINWIV
jgi:hypothetical protein